MTAAGRVWSMVAIVGVIAGCGGGAGATLTAPRALFARGHTRALFARGHTLASRVAADEAPLGAAPTLAQLLDNFAVLRRPQNAVDRSWQPNCGCGGAARQLSALTRYVGKAGGYGIYLDVEQLIAPGQLNLSAGSYVLNVDAVNRRGNNVSSTSFGPNTGFTVTPFEPYRNVWVGVVPDGVATVSWTFVCHSAEVRIGFCGRTGSQTVTVRAINNIAARHVTVLGGCRRTVGPPGFARCPGQHAMRVTWRGAGGHVVASFPGFGNLPAPPFVKGGRGYRVLRTLGATVVADAVLGQPWRSAEDQITRTLGPAADINVAVRDCGIQRETVWTSPAVADPLTVFEQNDRLAGYRYGAPLSQIGLKHGPGAVLQTARGLTVGQTIAQASRLYGPRLSTTAADGVGSWRVTQHDGDQSGLVLPITYPLRNVTNQNKIATIDAGNVGCAGAR